MHQLQWFNVLSVIGSMSKNKEMKNKKTFSRRFFSKTSHKSNQNIGYFRRILQFTLHQLLSRSAKRFNELRPSQLNLGAVALPPEHWDSGIQTIANPGGLFGMISCCQVTLIIMRCMPSWTNVTCKSQPNTQVINFSCG